MCVYECLYVLSTPHIWLVSIEVRRDHQISFNWSYRWLSVTTQVLETEPALSATIAMLLLILNPPGHGAIISPALYSFLFSLPIQLVALTINGIANVY